ncbi:ATP-binding cassette domain-containing protein [Parendozoicomonas haliclonae]|uniref:sn-glycerol-3-phosphate import ATP-binding protein UgpC n=1 Tax=Parendozoicomonas haliclonae TaxID=1960125 RepID=A0A1X7AMS8_9GAMM|nr:ATP-binding cassette domain-containing protein [Parendozoicomonas haliclonae]SMA49395.1 sn-glycerol-3-phosphate import ATP-binding protein UgpC [Parendozoicomonas haliclonae]
MSLEISDVSLRASKRLLIDKLSLSVAPGEIASIMGPSGCGKSTLLAWLCGALPEGITGSGTVMLAGERISDRPMEQRGIGLLFQDDLLFPHMNVENNLAFGLPAGLSRSERQHRIQNALRAAQLEGYDKHAPSQLSGGQRARISLMRTLLAEPKALLLDEPFSKLDAHLRGQVREFVFTTIQQRNIPALLVTHDRQDCPERIITLETNDTVSVKND